MLTDSLTSMPACGSRCGVGAMPARCFLASYNFAWASQPSTPQLYAAHQDLGERASVQQPLRGRRQAGQMLRQRELLPGAPFPYACPLARLHTQREHCLSVMLSGSLSAAEQHCIRGWGSRNERVGPLQNEVRAAQRPELWCSARRRRLGRQTCLRLLRTFCRDFLTALRPPTVEAGTPDADSVAVLPLTEAYALRSDTAAEDSASEPPSASLRPAPVALPRPPLSRAACDARGVTSQ